MPVSALRWGTNFENQVDIGYSLFDILTDREEREGSEHVQSPAGAEDSWIVGRDFTLQANVRWIPDGPNTNPIQTPLSGPVSWQEFLGWARDANALRFVPDTTVPDFYIDNVYLVEPRKGFGSLSTDIKRNVTIKLRNPTVDFHQALRGIMFEYAPGMSLTDPVAATFTRATAATRRGLPGTLVSPIGASDVAGVLRDRHYEGSLRTTLLEAARTQLVVDPENFGNWTIASGTPVRTGGQADPFGGTNAYLLNDDDGAVLEGIQQTVVFTGNATKAYHLFVKAGTAAITEIDITGAATRHRVQITWTAGVPTISTSAGAGTLFTVIPWGNGWYEINAAAAGVVAADTNVLRIFPAGTVAAATGTVLIFGANAWNADFPSSYQSPALTTRNVDQFSFPFLYKPQPMFVLVDFIENEPTAALADTRIVTLCADNEAGPRLLIYPTASTDTYTIRHEPVSGTLAGTSIDKNPVRGDRMVLLGVLNPDGSVKIGATKNGDAEAFSGVTGGVPFAAAWSSATVGIGSRAGSGSLAAYRAFARVKIGPLTFGGLTRDTIAKAAAV